MKVILVHNLFGLHARGGAERVVETIAEGARALGHEVIVFTAGEWTGLRSLWPRMDHSENPSTSLRVYRFFPLNFFSIVNIGRYPKWLRFFWHIVDALNDHPAWALLWVIKKEKPNVVWTHNLKGLGGWIPSLLRWLKLPHIHHLHDVQLIEPSGIIMAKNQELGISSRGGSAFGGKNQKWLSGAYVRLNRALMGTPTLVVSPTKWLLELHQQYGFIKHSKTLVLAHPMPSCEVRVSKLLVQATLNQSVIPSRARLGVASGEARVEGSRASTGEILRLAPLAQDDSKKMVPLNILFAGQLAAHKGIQFLVDTLKTAELPFAWQFHIAGAGALESVLRAKLAGDTRFVLHGRLSAEPFEQVWSQTDLTIVPSLCLENAPTVIMESLARGIPVLASVVGGIPEMVKEGETGWLFIAGDQDDFIKKLAVAVQCIQRGFRPEVPHLSAPSGYVSVVLAAVRMDGIPRPWPRRRLRRGERGSG